MPEAHVTPAPLASPLAPAAALGGGSDFFMSQGDWALVQAYLDTGIRLPVDATQAAKVIGFTVDEAGDYDDLWTAFSTIHDHCSDFLNTSYPAIVGVASTIATFGTSKVPVFYGAIDKIIAQVKAGTMTLDKAVVQMRTILLNLQADAQTKDTDVAAQAAVVDSFIARMKTDAAMLAPIKAKYQAQLDGEDGVIATLRVMVSVLRQQVEDEFREVARDEEIAMGSVVLFAVPVLGTITAACLTAVYFERARQERLIAEKDVQKLSGLQTRLKVAVALDGHLQLSMHALGKVDDALTAATPALAKAQAAWAALDTGIAGILATLATDIRDIATLGTKLDIDTVIAAWKTMAADADDFRANAFITIAPAPDPGAAAGGTPTPTPSATTAG
ncbi:MAG: hypothetical protein P0Y59_15990 [Candidatus Sphingomonas phytovorans]|nr:hypothetical protein [Sphingomonas sp.]WEJ98439.1 MAG: hypothetical protein P0Y59_15990 [Sphingomonas sp.]